jgi:hypothetical protein
MAAPSGFPQLFQTRNLASLSIAHWVLKLKKIRGISWSIVENENINLIQRLESLFLEL